jgi:hypothetical protein
MKLFKGNTFRDIQRSSWQTISADNGYGLLLGHLSTLKLLRHKIYDVLLFFQSKQTAFLEAASNDI